MNRRLEVWLMIGGTVLGLFAAGCRPSKPPDGAAADADSSFERPHRRVLVANPSTLMVQGALPVYYMFGQGGVVRIIDGTTGQLVATGPAEPQTLISIDSQSVRIGQRKVATGPFPADHRYEIWWDSRATVPQQPEPQPLQPQPPILEKPKAP